MELTSPINRTQGERKGKHKPALTNKAGRKSESRRRKDKLRRRNSEDYEHDRRARRGRERDGRKHGQTQTQAGAERSGSTEQAMRGAERQEGGELKPGRAKCRLEVTARLRLPARDCRTGDEALQCTNTPRIQGRRD